jgi:hypothetical protein
MENRTRFVKVTFFRRTSLRPVASGDSKQKEVRYLDIRQDHQLDKAQVSMCVRCQA